MLVTQPMVHLIFWFEDRNNNKGRHRAYLPFASSDNQVRAFVAFYMPYLESLSNASIVGWTATWSATALAPDMASSESDITQNLVLCYSTEDVYDWVWVPSPRIDLLEISGDYAGVRLDVLRPDVLAILDGWQDVIIAITNSRGDSFPVEFVAAGLAL